MRRRDLEPDPLAQFDAWFRAAAEANVPVPEAMVLATASAAGAPSARMVLLKGHDERGFVFYSGYTSRKGAELEANPRAALLFHWQALGRQVRVEGTVARLPVEESDAYFATRPLASRIAAAASLQSRPLESRAELERRVADLAAARGEDVPRPEAWGGYRLAPSRYEFWEHGDDRLHDRFAYERVGSTWRIGRLHP